MSSLLGLLRSVDAGALSPWEVEQVRTSADLVISNVVVGACATCGYWQGRVLSVSGTSGRFPSVTEAVNDGFLHPNCRHILRLHTPGVLPYRPRQSTNARAAAARDRQRAIERHIRRWKRREAAALDEQQRRYARAKVRHWQAQQRAHVAKTGRRREYARERA